MTTMKFNQTPFMMGGRRVRLTRRGAFLANFAWLVGQFALAGFCIGGCLVGVVLWGSYLGGAIR